MGVLELRVVTLELGGRPILNDLTVDFWEGHIHALIGPNGAGKSTLAGAIVDSKQLQTLMSRGLDEDAATDLIIDGLLA